MVVEIPKSTSTSLLSFYRKVSDNVSKKEKYLLLNGVDPVFVVFYFTASTDEVTTRGVEMT